MSLMDTPQNVSPEIQDTLARIDRAVLEDLKSQLADAVHAAAVARAARDEYAAMARRLEAERDQARAEAQAQAQRAEQAANAPADDLRRLVQDTTSAHNELKRRVKLARAACTCSAMENALGDTMREPLRLEPAPQSTNPDEPESEAALAQAAKEAASTD